MVIALTGIPVISYAKELEGNGDYNENTEILEQTNLAQLPELTAVNPEVEMSTLFCNAFDTIETDLTLNSLDASDIIKQRTTNRLPDNPLFILDDQLTVSDTIGIHLFTVTSNKFLMAQLNVANEDCMVRIYFVDFSTGTLTPSNIVKTAGELMVVSNLPTGDYAFVVSSLDNEPDISYTLSVNAVNPAGNLKRAYWLTSDLQEAGLLYTSNHLYSNGNLVFNFNNPAEHDLNWLRIYEVKWSGGYSEKTHEIYNVVLNSRQPYMTSQDGGPGIFSYKATSVSADHAVILNLGVGTGFSYMDSNYQSGGKHNMTMTDIFGKKTPRNLDQDDFDMNLGEFQIIYDLDKGKVVDFYGPLNFFYQTGAETVESLKEL